MWPRLPKEVIEMVLNIKRFHKPDWGEWDELAPSLQRGRHRRQARLRAQVLQPAPGHSLPPRVGFDP